MSEPHSIPADNKKAWEESDNIVLKMNVLANEINRQKERIDRLAKCVRIQRQALREILDTSSELSVMQLAQDALRNARW